MSGVHMFEQWMLFEIKFILKFYFFQKAHSHEQTPVIKVLLSGIH